MKQSNLINLVIPYFCKCNFVNYKSSFHLTFIVEACKILIFSSKTRRLSKCEIGGCAGSARLG